MKVLITGFARFSQAKKDNPQVVYKGLYVYVQLPVDEQYGKGKKGASYTIWDDQIARLLPAGPDSILNKTCDVYFDRVGNVEVIQVV